MARQLPAGRNVALRLGAAILSSRGRSALAQQSRIAALVSGLPARPTTRHAVNSDNWVWLVYSDDPVAGMEAGADYEVGTRRGSRESRVGETAEGVISRRRVEPVHGLGKWACGAALLAQENTLLLIYRKAFSTAFTNDGSSGATAGSKRARIVPSRPIRNFVKFHRISPPVFGFSRSSVRYS